MLDEAKLNGFIGRAVADWGALGSAALVRIGDRLGLYDALAETGPVTSAELAARTGTVERYVREWLLNQAASETLSYDPASGTYLGYDGLRHPCGELIALRGPARSNACLHSDPARIFRRQKRCGFQQRMRLRLRRVPIRRLASRNERERWKSHGRNEVP